MVESAVNSRLCVWYKSVSFGADDQLRVGWLDGFSSNSSTLEGVPREQEILKGHLPRVIYH